MYEGVLSPPKKFLDVLDFFLLTVTRPRPAKAKKPKAPELDELLVATSPDVDAARADPRSAAPPLGGAGEESPGKAKRCWPMQVVPTTEARAKVVVEVDRCVIEEMGCENKEPLGMLVCFCSAIET